MVSCGRYMSKFSVSKNMEIKVNNNGKRRTLAYLLTLLVEEVKINVEQGRVITTWNIIKH